MLPLNLSLTFLVMMLITPPMASEPYSAEAGPRMTSIRSMASIGGRKLIGVPAWEPRSLKASLPWAGRPSIRNRV